MNEKWFWVDDKVRCFAPAFKVESNSYETLDGRRIQVKEVLGDIMHIDQIGNDSHDMVMMDDINPASVLHNLRIRAERDEYFTNIGTILVSLNPFKWIDSLYSDSKFKHYRDRELSSGEESAPHFFMVSDDAFRGLRDDKTSQSIVISGESGSGKTEATKKCIQYLADVAGSKSLLENKLLALNPILEAFGNAKTVRNENSSRFGKWTTVSFDNGSRISGGRIVNYLLEKSRVVVQLPGERNYHVFYQVIKGADSALRKKLQLPLKCDDMEYLNKSGCMDVFGTDDSENFQELMNAFDEMGFSKEEQQRVLELVSGVLWLGNIQFQNPTGGSGDDPCQQVPSSAAETAASLLGIQVETLLSNVMNRIRFMGGQTIKSPVTATIATESCASVAREIYSALISVVNFINGDQDASF